MATIAAGRRLIAELPDGTVVTDPDILASYRQDRAADPDAGTPLAVVRPQPHRRGADRPAVGHRATGSPVVPRGMGTGLSGGATAVDGGIVLSTEKMRDITVDPVTRTAVVQPGLLNAEVKKAVAEHGLWYPPDPSSFEICSIGGNIATNAGGLCCVKYGVTTDYVLGPAGGAGRRHRGATRRAAPERRCGTEPDEAVRRQRGHPRGDHRGDAAAAARRSTAACTVVATFADGARRLRRGRRRSPRKIRPVDAGVHGRGGHQRRRGQAARWAWTATPPR